LLDWKYSEDDMVDIKFGFVTSTAPSPLEKELEDEVGLSNQAV
jgi:hypothetical protein